MGLEHFSREVIARQGRGRAFRSLYWLATEVLGYDKLSAEFHGPMLGRWDEIDRLRFKGLSVMNSLDVWPRDHIKTWCMRARVIRYYLYDPGMTVTGWHAVEEMMGESAVAIGTMLQTNKELRKLFDDGILPSPAAKRFIGSKGFSLRSNRVGDAPSFRAFGAGSEATGGHSKVGWLDDPVGLNDVMDNQMPSKRRWFEATVLNVVRSDGWIDVTGTRWPEDIYGDFMKSPHWVSTVRSCLETDGKPDYKGTPVYLTKQQIKKKRDQMGEYMFAFQMMNDEAAQGERPWRAECERTCTLKDVLPGAFKVVLSDPAPASPEAKLVDYEKNEWATVTVALQTRGQLREIIWLDGASSKEWTPSDGWSEVCRQKRKWQTGNVAVEKVGQAVAFYMPELEKLSRLEGVRHREYELTMTYKGKNDYFRRFCDRAKQGEFLICETVPKEMVEKALEQCRRWLPMKGGKNNLRLDDCANVLSFATDPVFRSYVPEPGAEEWSPYKQREGNTRLGGTKHVGW